MGSATVLDFGPASEWTFLERHWRHYDSDLGGVCVVLAARDMLEPMARTFRHVVEADTIDRPLPECFCDHVYLNPQLRRFERSAIYVREAYRIIRPGGTLLARMRVSHTALRAAGFTDVELRYSGDAWSACWFATRPSR